jgi:hypothetical protein
MASHPLTARNDGRGGGPRARRRRGLGLVLGAGSVTAGSVGGSYLAGVRLVYLGRSAHLSLPHDALLLLVITVGIAITVLGYRMIVYWDRRDERHHETISRMLQGQEGMYQKYEVSAYERWPMEAAPHGEQSPRQLGSPRSLAGMNGHGDASPLDCHQQTVLGAEPRSDVTGPGPVQPRPVDAARSSEVPSLTDAQQVGSRVPLRPGAGRGRARRRR